jgi:hypothetical protein
MAIRQYWMLIIRMCWASLVSAVVLPDQWTSALSHSRYLRCSHCTESVQSVTSKIWCGEDDEEEAN